jgi:hypothetical protein
MFFIPGQKVSSGVFQIDVAGRVNGATFIFFGAVPLILLFF